MHFVYGPENCQVGQDAVEKMTRRHENANVKNLGRRPLPREGVAQLNRKPILAIRAVGAGRRIVAAAASGGARADSPGSEDGAEAQLVGRNRVEVDDAGVATSPDLASLKICHQDFKGRKSIQLK